MENVNPLILPTEYCVCKRCHRKLKDEKSKQLGFGKTCYNKYIKSTQIHLFEISKMKGNSDEIK